MSLYLKDETCGKEVFSAHETGGAEGVEVVGRCKLNYSLTLNKIYSIE